MNITKIFKILEDGSKYSADEISLRIYNKHYADLTVKDFKEFMAALQELKETGIINSEMVYGKSYYKMNSAEIIEDNFETIVNKN